VSTLAPSRGTGATPGTDRGPPLRTLITVALCLAAGLAGASSAQAAPSGPYEPNDLITRAYGPLAPETPYSAAVELPGDSDWYYLDTSGPGPVELSLTLSGCSGSTSLGQTCNNVQLSAYDDQGALLARGNANAIGQTLALSFDAKAAGRISLEIRSAAAGGTYTLTTSFPSPQAAPPVKFPDAIAPFATRFELTYTGTPKAPRNRRISGLVVQDVAPGSTIIVRCTTGCVKRYRKTVMAKTTSRRLQGLPLRLRPNTRLRIEVRRPGFVGRYKDYAFTSGVPSPRTRASGCTSPYDFQPILCAS
jgi:hypothetical protein